VALFVCDRVGILDAYIVLGPSRVVGDCHGNFDVAVRRGGQAMLFGGYIDFDGYDAAAFFRVEEGGCPVFVGTIAIRDFQVKMVEYVKGGFFFEAL